MSIIYDILIIITKTTMMSQRMFNQRLKKVLGYQMNLEARVTFL